MLIKYRLIIITIITSILIGNIFFFLNSRSFISTFLMNPLSDDIFIESIKNVELKINDKRYEEVFNLSSGIYDSVTDVLKVELYSNIIRFLQNNKSYKYKFSKDFNLTKEQEKKYFSVIANINLEGAYFLNPKFLSFVKVQLFNNRKVDEEKLQNYLRFIIKKELIRLNNRENKSQLQYSEELIKKKNEFIIKTENILNFINRSSFHFNNLRIDEELEDEFFNYRSKQNIINIKKDLLFLSEMSNKIIKLQPIGLKDLEEMENKLFKILNFYVNDYLLNYNKYFRDNFYNFNDIDIRNVISEKIFYNQLYFISNNDWFIYNNSQHIFNDNNFDFLKIEKKIAENLEYISRKFNATEFISINLFSIIIAISMYYIFLNFRDKLSK